MLLFLLLLCGIVVNSAPFKTGTILKEVPFSVEYRKDIILFDDYINVICDNCFIEVQGKLMLHVEFSSYTVTLLEVGFRNLTINMGVGVTVLPNSYLWAFDWEKTIKVGAIQIVSFPPINLWVDLDILFRLQSMASLESSSVSFGNNVIMKLKDMYLALHSYEKFDVS